MANQFAEIDRLVYGNGKEDPSPDNSDNPFSSIDKETYSDNKNSYSDAGSTNESNQAITDTTDLSSLSGFPRQKTPTANKQPKDTGSATLSNFVSDVGTGLSDLPAQTEGAVASAIEGSDPREVFAHKDWKDRLINDARESSANKQLRSGGSDKYLDVLGITITRDNLRNFSQNAAFSLASMAASLGAGIAASPGGPIASAGAAAIAGGAVGYRADANNVLRNLRDSMNTEAQKDIGRKLTDDEFIKIAEAPQVQDAAKEIGLKWGGQGSVAENVKAHGLAEAGGEAIGNVLMLGAGKLLFELAQKSGVIEPLVTAIAGQAGEVATEAGTQLAQHNDELNLGLNPGGRPRSFGSLEDIKQSAKEVAGPTILLSGPLEAGAFVSGRLSRKSENKNTQPLEQPPENDTPPYTNSEEGKAEPLDTSLPASGNQDATGATPGVDSAGPSAEPSEKVPEKTKPVTNYVDPRLNRDIYRGNLEHMANNLEVGGGIALVPDPNFIGGESDKRDENGRPEAPLVRTKSLNPDWFKSMMEDDSYRLSVEKTQRAVEKAVNGKPLGVREARVVGAMLDHITGERTSPDSMDYAREQLRISREARAAAGMPDTNDWLLTEKDYPADADGIARAMLELQAEAQNTNADVANQIDELLYSDLSDKEILSRSAQILGEYHRGQNSETGSQTYQEPQEPAGISSTGTESVTGEPAATGQPGPESEHQPAEQQGLQPEPAIDTSSDSSATNVDESGVKSETTPESDISEGIKSKTANDLRQKKKPGIKNDKLESERRRNGLYRRSVDTMSMGERNDVIEQLRHDATVNKMTGLGSRLAWEDELPKAIDRSDWILAIDADSLGWVNGKMGAEAGDKLLSEIGKVLKNEFGKRAFHKSGDEFFAYGSDKGALESSAKAAQESLKSAKVEHDGSSITGLSFSYGIAKNDNDADKLMQKDKIKREKEGSRVAKTSRPEGVVLKGEKSGQSGAKQELGESDLAGAVDKEAQAKKHPGKKVTPAEHITEEAGKAEPSPTKEQIDAVSYDKGHPVIQGLNVDIENRVGTRRKKAVKKENIPLRAGDRFKTLSGRVTSPFPKTNYNRESLNEKKLHQWLKDEYRAEAESKGDDFNVTLSKGLDINNWSTADGDGINLYLFGDPEGRIGNRKVSVENAPKQKKHDEKTEKPNKINASADTIKAQADFDAAISELGALFDDKTSLKIMPVDEARLLPVLTKVMDAAFRLGYHKFKDAAKFTLDMIRDKIGDDVADSITLDHLQGSYIAMAGKYDDADSKKSVIIDTESIDDLNNHPAKKVEPKAKQSIVNNEAKDNEHKSITEKGRKPLVGVAAKNDSGAKEPGSVPRGNTESSKKRKRLEDVTRQLADGKVSSETVDNNDVKENNTTYEVPNRKRIYSDKAGRGNDSIASPIPAPGKTDAFINSKQGIKERPLREVSEIRVGAFKSGITKVTTPEDAAHILAPLRKYPVEQFMTLVLDKNKKPIAVIRHSIGAKDSANVYPGDVIGAIHATKGARYFIISHNHPSGIATESQADISITKRIEQINKGTGIEYLGHIIFGRDGYATYLDSDHVKGTIKARAAGRKNTVPLTEGKFTRNVVGEDNLLTSPVKTRQYISNNFLNKEGGEFSSEGILLLDNRNNPVGFYEIQPSDLKELRTGSVGTGASGIMQFARKTNAGAAIYLSNARADNTRNLGALMSSINIRMLDAMYLDRKMIVSSAENGEDLSKDTFFSRNGHKEGESIARDKIDNIVENSKSNIGAEIKVVDTESDLPEAIIKQAEKDGATGQVEAVHHKGVVYIVADKMFSRKGVEEALLHEGQHYAGDNYFGKQRSSAYQTLWFKISGKRGMKKLAEKIGFDMDAYFETADRLIQDGSIDAKQRAVYLVDEFLAHTKGKQAMESMPARVKQAIKEFIGKIRDMLRKSGFVELPKVSESDIKFLLKTINESVRKNHKAGESNNFPAFMIAYHGSHHEFDGSDNILFSRKTPDRKYTKEQIEAIEKGGFGDLLKAHESPLKKALGKAINRLDESKQVWKTILRQGFIDRFDSLHTILNDPRAWMMANLSQSSGGAVEAAIQYGKPFMNNGAVDVDVNKKSLSEIFQPLGKEVNDWLMWVAGNRAERLSSEDRERLFSDVNIQALKSLGNGVMLDGRNRKDVYESVRKDFEEMNDAFVKIGVKTGVIPRDEEKVWRSQGFYVPFYRVASEENKKGVMSPYTNGGLIRQTAYKRLTGADIPIGDLLTNVIMNWNHIVSSGLKNQAAAEALATAEDMGLATQVPESDKSSNAVFIRINGKKMWLELDDSKEGQLVLESLMALNYEGMNNFMMRAARKFKRFLTYGVTASPEFKISNLIRDSIQAISVADMSTNIVKNISNGFSATKKGNQTIARMIAGGGAFGDSGYIHGSDPEALQRLVNKDVDRMTILDSPHRIQKMWDAYQDLGARLENINRAAQFEQDISRGKDLLEANFNSRDQLDFQRNGAFKTVRILTQVVPFLNARLQGIDKLARSAKDKGQRKQFFTVITTYALASVLLYLYMKDDDDYKQAPEWERDTYHLFKIPGSDVMFRIPRPFEVGFIASVAERAVEQVVDDKVHGKLFFNRLLFGLENTLSFNPVPQIAMPALEVWANKDTFTGRQIESDSMKNLSPPERKRAWTSETAIALSKGFDSILWDDVVLSPPQIEHLVDGYFGWLGATVLASSDMLIRDTGLMPSKPARRIQDYAIVGRFARTGPTRGSKYTTEFYKNLHDIDQVYADIRFSAELGNKEKAIEIAKKNKDIIAIKKIYSQAQRAVSKLNKAMLIIRMKKISPEEKRRQIDRLMAMKNKITEKVIERTDSYVNE